MTDEPLASVQDLAKVSEARRNIFCPSPTDRAVLDPREEVLHALAKEVSSVSVPDWQAAVIPSPDEQNSSVSVQPDLTVGKVYLDPCSSLLR